LAGAALGAVWEAALAGMAEKTAIANTARTPVPDTTILRNTFMTGLLGDLNSIYDERGTVLILAPWKVLVPQKKETDSTY
jgi:hypothetical protein